MPDNEIAAARLALRREMPHALRNVLEHYNLFVATQMPTDIKEFNEFNAAGRGAITHLQMQLKLYKMLGGDVQNMDELGDEIAAAEASLADEDEDEDA